MSARAHDVIEKTRARYGGKVMSFGRMYEYTMLARRLACRAMFMGAQDAETARKLSNAFNAEVEDFKARRYQFASRATRNEIYALLLREMYKYKSTGVAPGRHFLI